MNRISILVVLLIGLGGPLAAGTISRTVPSSPDTDSFYLFYQHGKIVEGSDGRPTSPQFGPYEYRAILETFSDRGFEVISDIRRKNADVEASSKDLGDQVERLIDSGVPAFQITLVGASKGGVIVLRASNRLKKSDIRVVVLAGMFAGLADEQDLEPHGAVLSIHDSSDASGIEPNLFLEGAEGVSESRVVVTDLDLGHGLLYSPHSAWVDEVVRWSGIRSEGD